MIIVFNRESIYTTFAFRDADYKEMARVAILIGEVTCARPSGYLYMPVFKSGHWDGYVRLMQGNRFPTGLLSAVVDHLRASDYPHIEVLNYETPEVNPQDIKPDMFAGITLRSYQIEAARLCIAYNRGILKMATNSGKTEVIAALAKVIPGNILVLTTKKDLLHQTADRIAMRLQENVGLIGDGQWEPKRITVGMIQTLCLHLNEMKQTFDGSLVCVMYDECHHVSSRSSQSTLLGLDAPMRFGFSGTPLKYDDLSDLLLIAATGPVLLEVTNADLIDAGISAKPSVKMHVVDNLDNDGTWQEAYDECIVKNSARNALICQEVIRAKAHSTLILVARIEHGRLLYEQLTSMLFSNIVLFVHGSVDITLRQEALEVLRKGNGAVVIATAAIFGEGVDVPAVDLLLLANGGKSRVKLLQNIGRGLRSKGGANCLQIIDFLDDTNCYLLEHTLARTLIYEQEGFDVYISE